SIAVAEPEAGEDSTTKPAAQEPAAAQSTDTPPGATDYPAPAHNLPQPPTPPVSNPGAGSIVSQDLAPTSGVASVAPPGSFLTGGGKPWYLENYDPKTRTFEEPPPAVEEAVEEAVAEEVEVEEEVEEEVGRATSDEELSEIDDEEMRDLEEGMDVEMAGVGEKSVEKPTPKKAKAKKRRRAY
ncbi:hypothetical protein V494_04629, partial [Pseudogymnoascus sp. VKM F-4513 (FW-928)]